MTERTEKPYSQNTSFFLLKLRKHDHALSNLLNSITEVTTHLNVNPKSWSRFYYAISTILHGGGDLERRYSL